VTGPGQQGPFGDQIRMGLPFGSSVDHAEIGDGAEHSRGGWENGNVGANVTTANMSTTPVPFMADRMAARSDVEIAAVRGQRAAKKAAKHKRVQAARLKNSSAKDLGALADVNSDSASAQEEGAAQTMGTVIFCDVNGVLRRSGSHLSKQEWDASCVAALKHVVNSTDACIVLSSSWRSNEFQLQCASKLLAEHGLPPLVGKTPRLAREHHARGDEIIEWLQQHGQGICAWVALDDGAMHVRKHKRCAEAAKLDHVFVRCQSRRGLTMELATRATQLLRQQQGMAVLGGSRADEVATTDLVDAANEVGALEQSGEQKNASLEGEMAGLAVISTAAPALAGGIGSVRNMCGSAARSLCQALASGDVHTSPDCNSKSIRRLAKGEVVAVLASQSCRPDTFGRCTWLRIADPSGTGSCKPVGWTALSKKDGTLKLNLHDLGPVA